MVNIINTDITIIIKTFNRKEALIKLLKSVEKLKMTYPIAIADDSEKPYKDEILRAFPNMNISYYELPFDSGLSYGRNFLLNHISTGLFLLCDDDFYFDKRADIEGAKQLLLNNDVDILSGVIYNFFKVANNLDKFLMTTQHLYSRGFKQTYVGYFKIEGKVVNLDIKTRSSDDFIRCDTVHNFFIGNKNTILDIGGWDNNLKLHEHEEFFLRAKEKGLKVAHSSIWGARHYPILSKDYIKYRNREPEIKYLFEKYGIEEWIQDVDNGSTFIKKYINNEIVNERIFHDDIRGFFRKMYNKFLR